MAEFSGFQINILNLAISVGCSVHVPAIDHECAENSPTVYKDCRPFNTSYEGHRSNFYFEFLAIM